MSDDNSKRQEAIHILIEGLLPFLPQQRISVEAEEFDCWKKAGGDRSREYWVNFEEGR